MNHLKYLEFQRLIKELQFLESDYLYRSEILKISDMQFLESVNLILNTYPELKQIFQTKESEILIENKIENQEIIEESVIIKEEAIPNIKRMYRDIVKNTHPDKIKNLKLNDLYIEATEAYEQNDIVTLYKVCSELNIEFDLSDDFITKIQDKINLYRQRISFIEKTYTSQWARSENPTDKNKIIINYIKGKLDYI